MRENVLRKARGIDEDPHDSSDPTDEEICEDESEKQKRIDLVN
jgi:hypothetical protein